MSLKSFLRNNLSPRQLKRVKWLIMQYRFIKNKNKKGLLQVDNNFVDSLNVVSVPGKHVFFGYYDLQQADKSKEHMLVHIVDSKNNNPAKDTAGIALVSMADFSIEVLTSTNAWSWQQGARLRWHPTDENLILFNDYCDGKYVMVELDIRTKERVNVYPMSMYDVTSDMCYGLGVNFDRLQRLRPGYGYSNQKDTTAGMDVPKEDGIYRYDFVTGKKELLVSYEDLVKGDNFKPGFEHYINHVSISPSNTKFMFFHLWASVKSASWDMNLYIGDIKTGELKCIEKNEIASHYCWKNDNELLITTAALNDRKSQYILYNLETNEKKVLNGEWLQRDGHPTVIGGEDTIISDTYPIKSVQYVFLEEGTSGKEIARAFSDPRMFDDMRCDLHPRVTCDGKLISIDTTHDNKVRQVVVLKLK